MVQVSLPRRLHVFGIRIHHGLVGCGAVLTGIALMAHDWADRWWLPRRETRQ
jgi:hypothetical protein